MIFSRAVKQILTIREGNAFPNRTWRPHLAVDFSLKSPSFSARVRLGSGPALRHDSTSRRIETTQNFTAWVIAIAHNVLRENLRRDAITEHYIESIC